MSLYDFDDVFDDSHFSKRYKDGLKRVAEVLKMKFSDAIKLMRENKATVEDISYYTPSFYEVIDFNNIKYTVDESWMTSDALNELKTVEGLGPRVIIPIAEISDNTEFIKSYNAEKSLPAYFLRPSFMRSNDPDFNNSHELLRVLTFLLYCRVAFFHEVDRVKKVLSPRIHESTKKKILIEYISDFRAFENSLISLGEYISRHNITNGIVLKDYERSKNVYKIASETISLIRKNKDIRKFIDNILGDHPDFKFTSAYMYTSGDVFSPVSTYVASYGTEAFFKNQAFKNSKNIVDFISENPDTALDIIVGYLKNVCRSRLKDSIKKGRVLAIYRNTIAALDHLKIDNTIFSEKIINGDFPEIFPYII
jgi:hypothetical protein